MFKRDNILIFILILCLIPTLFGLFHPGFPSTDDGSWMIIRFASFFTALRHGQFPVRFLMSLNHGYGYPVSDFLYPLFMYFGVPIHIIGFGFINTIKIILGVSLLLSGLFCFLWFKKIFNSLAAFVGALCYVLFPYHLYDVYQRGSVGEVVALAVVPFIFLQAEKQSFLFTSIGIALLILAHNTLALLFLPIIISYLFFKKLFTLKSIGMIILLSLGLSTFFWIPALFDKQYTVFDSVSVSNYTQYFLTSKNFGIVGLFSLMISILGVGYAFKKNKKNDLFFLVVIYIGIFFSLPISSLFWRWLPLPQLVQFPFRFLSLAILGTAFFTAFMIHTMKTSLKYVIALLCIFLLYITSWSYLFPRIYQTYDDSYYSTNQDTTTVKNEYMPKWVKQIPLTSVQNKIEVIKGKASISDITSLNGDRVQFKAIVSKASVISINVIYFPGWSIFVNNKPHSFSYFNSKGVMYLELPSGNYIVTARFGETQVRAISDFISLLSVIIVGGLLLNFFRKK